MRVTISADHRVHDGAYAAKFLGQASGDPGTAGIPSGLMVLATGMQATSQFAQRSSIAFRKTLKLLHMQWGCSYLLRQFHCIFSRSSGTAR